MPLGDLVGGSLSHGVRAGGQQLARCAHAIAHLSKGNVRVGANS
jgi:hypothetical protein